MNARLIPAMIGALLALAALVGCASAPVQPLPSPTRPAARAPTVAPIAAPPTQAPRTQPPTAAPPTAAPPTHAPTARAPTETPAPTAAPQPAVYIVYSKPDGSLWRADGHDEQPVQLAGPAEPGAVPPWAASPDGRTIAFVTGVGV